MRSPSQCRPLRWLAPLAGLWAATCAPALAQDAPAEEAEGPPPVSAPTLRAVGFRDLDDGRDCDLLEARYGRCIEEVAFSSPWDVEGEAGKEDYARWLNTSELYLEMWDDMARRWFRDGDLLPESLGPDGHAALPPANLQWEASFPDRGAGDQRGRVFCLAGRRRLATRRLTCPPLPGGGLPERPLRVRRPAGRGRAPDHPDRRALRRAAGLQRPGPPLRADGRQPARLGALL
jgi:hypothetical protein